jgi:hypothetical protein
MNITNYVRSKIFVRRTVSKQMSVKDDFPAPSSQILIKLGILINPNEIIDSSKFHVCGSRGFAFLGSEIRSIP